MGEKKKKRKENGFPWWRVKTNDRLSCPPSAQNLVSQIRKLRLLQHESGSSFYEFHPHKRVSKLDIVPNTAGGSEEDKEDLKDKMLFLFHKLLSAEESNHPRNNGIRVAIRSLNLQPSPWHWSVSSLVSLSHLQAAAQLAPQLAGKEKILQINIVLKICDHFCYIEFCEPPSANMWIWVPDWFQSPQKHTSHWRTTSQQVPKEDAVFFPAASWTYSIRKWL